MKPLWDPETYDLARRRIVPHFDEFYGTAAALVAELSPGGESPRVLELGAGTGIFSEAIARRVPGVRLELLDGSAGMLERAVFRLGKRPPLHVQAFSEALPEGSYDAVVSAIALHHLTDPEKRDLYGRIFGVLAAGGLFLNAEEIAGRSARWEKIGVEDHHAFCRSAGCSEEEMRELAAREVNDLCAPLETQLRWLEEIGYCDVEAPWRNFRFAIFAGFRPGDA